MSPRGRGNCGERTFGTQGRRAAPHGLTRRAACERSKTPGSWPQCCSSCRRGRSGWTAFPDQWIQQPRSPSCRAEEPGVARWFLDGQALYEKGNWCRKPSGPVPVANAAHMGPSPRHSCHAWRPRQPEHFNSELPRRQMMMCLCGRGPGHRSSCPHDAYPCPCRLQTEIQGCAWNTMYFVASERLIVTILWGEQARWAPTAGAGCTADAALDDAQMGGSFCHSTWKQHTVRAAPQGAYNVVKQK